MARDLEEKIHQEIKQVIISGLLAPGTQLVERELCDHFGASRTPVRLALHRLEREKLLRILPNRGTFVVSPTVDEIRQAYQVRIHLEGLATRLAADQISPDQIREGRRLIDLERQAFRNNQPSEIFRLSTEFHELVAKASGNIWLFDLISQLIAQCVIYLAFYDMIDPDHPKSPGWHESVLDALEAGDADRAESLMVNHLVLLEQGLNTTRSYLPPPWQADRIVGTPGKKKEEA